MVELRKFRDVCLQLAAAVPKESEAAEKNKDKDGAVPSTANKGDGKVGLRRKSKFRGCRFRHRD